jgi:hypothetical protein
MKWRGVRATAALAALLSAAVALQKTTTDKVFFIGPNKTGTTSIAALFRSLGYRACHRDCPRQRLTWADASRNRNLTYFKYADIFVDVGDLADFVWLSQQFPTSRFVCNMRPLKMWLLSRVDMYRRWRERMGCSPYGLYEAGDRCGPRGLSSNDGETILRFVVSVAATQDALLTYFQSSPGLMNRFAAHDFIGGSADHAAGTRALIDWITRPDLGAQRAERPVLSPAELPTRAAGALVEMPHKYNYGAHSPETVRLVSETLETYGCTEDMHGDVWFARCAAAIMDRRKRLRMLFEDVRAKKLHMRPRVGGAGYARGAGKAARIVRGPRRLRELLARAPRRRAAVGALPFDESPIYTRT